MRQGGNMDANSMIKAIVDKHEAVYMGDLLYNKFVTRMSTVGLENISKSDVTNIIEPFLYEWGRMGRVLGRPRFNNWQGNVAQIIKSNCAILKQFQTTNIENEDLTNNKNEIIRLYQSFTGVTGQIAGAKILNLICPDFFPLWDNTIASGIRLELADLVDYSFDKNIKNFSGQDYFRFAEGIKIFMLRHNDIISQLSNQYHRKKLRIIDECLWWMARRPFFLIF
jgi:hypothetical protein